MMVLPSWHRNGLFLARDYDKELALEQTVTDQLLDGDSSAELLVMKKIHWWPLPFECFFGPHEFHVTLG
jgi:hypothetical protein